MNDQPLVGDVLLRPYEQGDPVPPGWTVVESDPFGLVIYRVLTQWTPHVVQFNDCNTQTNTFG